MSTADYMEHLYRAVSSPHGIIVECDDVLKLRARLYALRGKDPAFQNLTFAPSPLNPRELWIINKEQVDGE